MQVGEVTQVVKVEGEPVIDLQNNQTSTTFDQNLLQEIPSGRDPWSTVAQMPGATVGTFDVAATTATSNLPCRCTGAPKQSRFTAITVWTSIGPVRTAVIHSSTPIMTRSMNFKWWRTTRPLPFPLAEFT